MIFGPVTNPSSMENELPENEALFQVRGLTKHYGERRVLSVERLDVYPGEILALVGPSGVGKSTLLRLLNFLEPPTTGTISFQGCTYNGAKSAPLATRRRITTVFQRPLLLDRSVEANVSYVLQLRGRHHQTSAVHQALEEVGLAMVARQPARTLSGGEAQRVALARALILEPDALLLDEPTANLDPYNVGLIETIVSRHNQERKTTVVLVTHNIFQARRLAHRVALMLDGNIVEVANTDTFFNAPRDARTAAFVRGEMIY
jgi:tungstate transport system ATP-binding protein